MSDTVLRNLPTGDVYPNPKQPRKLFEKRALEDLGDSIRERGLLQPIKVRPDGRGAFMIVAGERRWRAHTLIGAPTILAVVEDMTDDDLADAAIVENLQRKDITPLEEARAFQARLDTGLTVEDLARRLGLRQPWRITERTALLRLAPEFQVALDHGILTPSQAFEMSRLPPARQKLVFDAIGAGRCKTYAELRRVVQAHLDAEAQVDMFAAPTADDDAARDRARALGRRIDEMAEALAKGFSRSEIALIAETTEARSGVLGERIELMEKALKALRLELAAAAAMRAA